MIPTPMPLKTTYKYEVYRLGVLIGTLSTVTSPFKYSQMINTDGVSLKIDCAININVPGQDVAGTNASTSVVANGDRIKVWEYTKWYPNGKVAFQGQVNEWDADFDNDMLNLLVFSDGFDMSNVPIEGEGSTVDVSQLTQNASILLQNSASGTYLSVGQSFLTGGGVNDTSRVRLMLNTQNTQATVVVKIYSSVNSGLLATVQRTINNNAPEVFDFVYSPPAGTSPATQHFFDASVTQDAGQALIYYNDANPYASGAMYLKTSEGGSHVITPTGSIATASDLYFRTEHNGNTTEFTYSNEEISAIVLDGMSIYAASGGLVSASFSNVHNTGVTLPLYAFKLATPHDFVEVLRRSAPAGTYSYVDVGTSELNFKQTLETALHKVSKGNGAQSLKLGASIKEVMNTLYVTGGDTGGGVNLFKLYVDATSRQAYRPRMGKLNDPNLTDDDTADLVGTSEVNSRKDEQYRTTLKVLMADVDISQYKIGDPIGFENYGNFIDFLILQVVAINREDDCLVMSLGTLPPRNNLTLKQVKDNLQTLQEVNNPDSPS